jgi:hypothetical protein
MTNTTTSISRNEAAVLRILIAAMPTASGRFSVSIESVEARSAREYDLGISGQFTDANGSSYKFSGWLPLSYIHELGAWTTARLAAMTDYPEMARSGDWSGVRDSSVDSNWAMFEYVLGSQGAAVAKRDVEFAVVQSTRSNG